MQIDTLGARDFSSAVSGFRGFGLRPTPKIPAVREKSLWYPGLQIDNHKDK